MSNRFCCFISFISIPMSRRLGSTEDPEYQKPNSTGATGRTISTRMVELNGLFLSDSNRCTKLSSSQLHSISGPLGMPSPADDPLRSPLECHQHSTDTVRSERATRHQCQICECVEPLSGGLEDGVNDGNLPYFCQRFFHDRCTTCLPPEPSLDPLCSFCNHLRLPHIFRCVAPELKNLPTSYLPKGFVIVWGKGYRELMGDQTCPLCSFIRAILRNYFETMDEDDEYGLDDSILVEFFTECHFFYSSKPESWNLRIHPPPYLTESRLARPHVKMNMAKDSSGTETYSEPLFGPDVNWELVRKWVWNCHLDHPSRKIPIDSTDKDFRLIDVRNNCLVSASKSWTYAALSYVWGDSGAQNLQAVLANVSRLEQKGGLLLHELPQCILDALTVCKNLGVNFLWVDRLCIVQDDAQSKHGQIKQMGSIYASAVVTIVAAAGKDAGHGLVGVSRPRPFAQFQQKLLLQGIKFTENLQAKHFSELIQQSVWKSRGWTFQEEKLSTALLVFSECGVSFQCKHRPGRMEIEMGILTELDDVRTDPSTLYPSVVSEYSRRTLSFGSDILNGFSGYLGMEFNDQHYFGLPCAHFTQALLWKSADNSALPRKSNDIETFPSWSWTSITGPVDYHSWFDQRCHEPIASWAAVVFPPGRTPQLFPVCESASTLPSPLQLLKELLFFDNWAIAASYRSCWRKPEELKSRKMPKAAWRRDLVKQSFLSPILHGELDRFWIKFPRRMKSYGGFWFQNAWLWMKHNLLSNANLGLDPDEVFRPGRLLAYTQTASVSVTRMIWPTSFVLNEKAPFVLRNKWGKWIGFVDPDRPTVERIDAYTLRGETYLAECLALSLHKEDAQTPPLLLDEEFDTLQDQESEPDDDEESKEIFRKRSYDFWTEMGCLEHQVHKRTTRPSEKYWTDYPLRSCPPQLTVMMVERTEGVARRVGVGNVYLKRWRESAPSVQSVVLA